MIKDVIVQRRSRRGTPEVHGKADRSKWIICQWNRLVEAVGIELEARLKLRRLLILRFGKVAKNPEFAEARYTPGTQWLRRTRAEFNRLVKANAAARRRVAHQNLAHSSSRSFPEPRLNEAARAADATREALGAVVAFPLR
jgi:hypothetical protein